MTVSTPDIQALIEEANRMAVYVAEGGPDDGTVYTRLAAALSALSGETETEWEYGSRSRAVPTAIHPDDPSGWNAAEHYPEAWDRVRRRKAGPWIEVTK